MKNYNKSYKKEGCMSKMIEWEKLTKEDSLTIYRIAKRAKGKLSHIDLLSLEMDLSATHLNSPLRLKDLEIADDFNFMHDICGIMRNINRETGELENCFLPRFSR